MRLKRLALLLVVPLFALGVAACGSDDSDTVKIGVADASENYWKCYKDKAADEGIDGRVRQLHRLQPAQPGAGRRPVAAQRVPAPAVPGELQRQEQRHLQPIGATAVYPLPLYSTKHTSVDEIPQGGKVAIPNDPTNQARALLVLQQAGPDHAEGRRQRVLHPRRHRQARRRSRSPRSTPRRPRRACELGRRRDREQQLRHRGQPRRRQGDLPGRPEQRLAEAVHQRLRRPDKDKNNADLPEARRALPRSRGRGRVPRRTSATAACSRPNPPTDLQELTKEARSPGRHQRCREDTGRRRR